MAYNILLTSLYEADKDAPICYYFAKEGNKKYYCDAMLTVEASTKYVLAQHPIDEIITLGRKLTYDEGDDKKLIELREGQSFYTSDISQLSTYSCFRYRIAQYIDELKIEQRDIMDLISPEMQKKVISYTKSFYKKASAGNEYMKFNRFFDVLSQDESLLYEFKTGLVNKLEIPAAEFNNYLQWTLNYLYSEFKDSSKLELLEGNEDVKVRFIPTGVGEDGKVDVDNIIELVRSINAEHNEVNLYVALHSDDVTDTYVLMNVLDILKAMFDNNVKVCKVLTTSSPHDCMSGEIKNDTEGYGITELVAATKTFLNYGKVDMIVDYWEKCGSSNDRIDRMIYAMRHIDVGISLCHITEIENGIRQLHDVFSQKYTGEEDYYSKLFTILSDGIKYDYGTLVTDDEINFIDLVRWAYKKKFYQQTLTLIESRAPEIFVDKGIFYYCDDEEKTAEIVNEFAKQRSYLKPYETYIMDDLNHYFIKLYGRKSKKIKRGGKDQQKAFADYKVDMIGSDDPDEMHAYSCCEDKEALSNLLYAYFHVGEVRNRTNHADERDVNMGILMVDEKEVSNRLAWIRDSIEFFLHCYDIVSAEIEGKEPVVVTVTPGEVRSKTKEIINQRKNAEKDGVVDPKADTKAKPAQKAVPAKTSAASKTAKAAADEKPAAPKKKRAPRKKNNDSKDSGTA